MESWKVFLNVPRMENIPRGKKELWRGEERGGEGGSLTRCRENLHRFCII